ncbi:MAG: hypothetical protein PUJ11_02550 [Eubacteriaceae bacterium]|nr:hypothetical protein [Eubacteriaceae bacterium]
MHTLKIVVGVVLVIVSFAYILKNPGQSMMDGLMKKRNEMYEKEMAKASQIAEAEAAEGVSAEAEAQEAKAQTDSPDVINK